MKTKVCKHCGRELPVDQFSSTNKTKDGLQSWCKECHHDYYAKLSKGKSMSEDFAYILENLEGCTISIDDAGVVIIKRDKKEEQAAGQAFKAGDVIVVEKAIIGIYKRDNDVTNSIDLEKDKDDDDYYYPYSFDFAADEEVRLATAGEIEEYQKRLKELNLMLEDGKVVRWHPNICDECWYIITDTYGVEVIDLIYSGDVSTKFMYATKELAEQAAEKIKKILLK